jgi:hypothetical protein
MNARPMGPLPSSKLLFITHLSERLADYESRTSAMDPVAYRLWARRLREATAGANEAWLAETLGDRHPQVLEAAEIRYFDTHGQLGPGPDARTARRHAEDLLARLLGS